MIERLLEQLVAEREISKRIAIVVAHPDDETIGAGATLSRLADVLLVHVTDGAPRDLEDARRSGCASREEYAALRGLELARALALAGISFERTRELGLIDQQAAINLKDLTVRLSAFLREFRPDAILTHPYEGGHPDHDATAFAVHCACALIGREDSPPPIIEMAFYHQCDGHPAMSSFIPRAGYTEWVRALSAAEQSKKQALLDCFESQRGTLKSFPVDAERFREAPPYDFAQPPHSGTLHYERFNWGMTGPRFRELARRAQQELGLSCKGGLSPRRSEPALRS